MKRDAEGRYGVSGWGVGDSGWIIIRDHGEFSIYVVCHILSQQ